MSDWYILSAVDTELHACGYCLMAVWAFGLCGWLHGLSTLVAELVARWVLDAAGARNVLVG